MRPKHILIVDDERRFRESIKRILKDDQYTFFEAGSVQEGIRKLDQNPEIGVVLLDLALPDGSGTELLQHIVDLPSRNRVVIITAHDEQLAAGEAKDFSVFSYLPKASRGFTQSIRFSIQQAFKDIERQLLKEKSEVLSGIQKMVMAQASTTELNDILQTICRRLRQFVGAYSCHVRLYDLQTGDLHLAAFEGPDEAVRRVFSKPKQKAEPFSGVVARDKMPLLVRDLQSSGVFKSIREQALKNSGNLHDDAMVQEARQFLESVQSAFIVPITTHLFADEVDAVLSVMGDSVDFFSEQKREVIAEFATQAAMAIARTWLVNRKEESHADYQSINRVLDRISKELGGENAKANIYEIVVTGISEIIKPEAISINLYNKKTGLLDNEAEFRGLEWFEPSNKGRPIDKGLTALVYSTGKPLRMPDLQKGDRRRPDQHESADQDLVDDYVKRLPSGRINHYLGVPMIIGNEVIGAIQLLNKKSAHYHNEQIDTDRWLLERGFSDDDEVVLGIAAHQLALALSNADLLEERRKQISQLAILKDVGRFTSSETLGELLDKIIREAAEEANAELCLLFLVDETKRRVVLAQRYGISEADLPEASYEIGEGFTGAVTRTHESYFKERDVPPGKYDRPILEHLQKSYGIEKKIESLMIVPIKVKGDLLGVIKVINKKGGNQHYDEDDLQFLETFASYVGIAIENAQRYEMAIKKLTMLEHNAALSNLVRAVVHEINNTQALIPINIQLIRNRLSHSNFDITEMIDVIEDSATQAVAFANSIQAFAVSRLGEKKTQDVNSIIQKALRQLRPTLDTNQHYKQVVLDLTLSPETLDCSVYETPLIQVIQNIVVNAYQAMDTSKIARLRITSSRDTQGRLARISFSDTGRGIKPEFLTKIFDPDFSTKRIGTGIGLWLAKNHLSTISAHISVRSSVNGGTTFDVEIPLAEGSA
jgi:GAF domain-containing protein/ActR/RegA family two-component response regulator